MADDVKSLVAKLAPKTKIILERAAQEAVSHGNSTIEVEHFLKCSLDEEKSAIVIALKRLKEDRNIIARELNSAIERFPKSASRTPTFSSQLLSGFREAWTIGSVEFEADAINTCTFLYAALTELGLKAAISNSSPTLCAIDVNILAQKLKVFLAQSSEETSLSSRDELEEVSENSPLLLYTQDLTAKADDKNLDPVIGRDNEIHEIINILMRRRQNNPILLGKPGVGKTAVIEGLAQKINSGDVPKQLNEVRLLALDLTQMAAGASIKGEYEKRLKSVIKEVEENSSKTILFIDEAHSLIGAGGEAGKSDAANILKPALARGELRVIAATTFAEYKKHIEKDAALDRRFQPVKIEEPSIETTKTLLSGLAHMLEDHHGVRIDQQAIDAAVELSSRYIISRQQPDKAISILDTACAKLSSAQGGKPIPIQNLMHQLEVNQIELDRLEHDKRLLLIGEKELSLMNDKIEVINSKIANLNEQYQIEQELVENILEIENKGMSKHLSPELSESLLEERQNLINVQGDFPLKEISVSRRTVASAVSDWTGIPLANLLNKPEEKLNTIYVDLKNTIFGQDYACKVVSDRMRLSAAGLNDPGRPLGVFLLVGPSGVGKTETAKAIADLLFLGAGEMITINMSEFQESHSVASLRGAPPGYVGYGEGGVLTEAVKRTPHNVLLLDEFEKAHMDVREIFYQVFDEGRLDDSDGDRVDFCNTIIFVTSNTGSEIITAYAKNGKFSSAEMDSDLNISLSSEFSPALLGRMNIVPYTTLSYQVLKQIALDKFSEIAERLEKNFGFDVTLDNGLMDLLIKDAMQNNKSGARGLIHLIEIHVLPKITDVVLTLVADNKQINNLHVSYKNNDIDVVVT
jgi:type VI secretion system protein VasG